MPSATTILTHEGKTVNLELDPPPVVRAEVVRAVQQWVWERVERVFPQLRQGNGRQSLGEMRSIWQVLSSKTKAGRWDHAHKAALKPVFMGRQWTHARRRGAKLAEHDRCIICFATSFREHHLPCPTPTPTPLDFAEAGAIGEGGRAADRSVSGGDEVDVELDDEPRQMESLCRMAEYDAILANTPAGTMVHRNWHCKAHDVARAEHGPARMQEFASTDEVTGVQAFERAVFPAFDDEIPQPSLETTFVCVQWPAGGTYKGTIYTEGSRIFGMGARTVRIGWASAVIDRRGRTTAKACGVTPRWLDDMPGEEA